MTDTQRVDVERLSEIAHWLRRFSDDGQHKRIQGPSSGDAYEAGVEIDGIVAALLQKIDQLNDDLSTARQSLYECAGQRNDALSSLADAEAKLAEREAEIERLTEQVRQWERSFAANVYVPNDEYAAMAEKSNRADTAERAREEVERDALLMARWISNLRLEPWQEVDHACEQCRPGGEIVKAWFICGRHTAAAFLAANGGDRP